MGINNINTIQNKASLSYLNSLTDNYLIQALANLGQRIGIKGDSVKYGGFTFLDIFDDKYIDDISNKIGVLKYVNENNTPIAKFYIIDKGKKFDESNILDGYELKYSNIFDKQFISNNITFDILIGNTKEITNESIFQVTSDLNNEYFSNILYKVILGKENEETNNLEIEYNKYNSTTNKLLFSAKAFYLYSDGTSNYYSMITVENINETSYKMHVYLFNSSLLNNNSLSDLKTQFENCFNLSSYNTSDNLFFDYTSKLNIENIDNIFNYDLNNGCTVFGMIKNNFENNELNKNNEDITLNYNIDNTTLSIAPNQNIQKSLEILSKDGLTLETRLTLINNDINYIYPILLKYYSSNQFTSVLSSLAKKIFCKIYEHLYLLNDNETYNTMYIPLDYEIKYLANNNKLQLYYSSNINISFEDLSILNDIEIEDYFNNTKMITFDYTYESKVKLLNFEVKYNDKYEDCINNILINDIYTSPYINSLNNWVINDISTQVSALGKNAGNPNIIIILSKPDSYNILSSSNIDLTNTEFIDETFLINDNLLLSDYSDTVKCKIPKLTETNLDLFYYSIIINLSTIECLSNYDETKKDDYKLNIITSLWIVTKTNDEIKFDYIKEPDKNCALDLSYLLNTKPILNDLINNLYKSIPTEFNKILLKANNKTNYQESGDNTYLNWAVIKNKLAEEYNNLDEYENKNEQFLYENDLNLIIQYNDTLKNNTESSQSEKYLLHFNKENNINSNNINSYITVTNNLYKNVEYSEIPTGYSYLVTTYTISDIITYSNIINEYESITDGDKSVNENIVYSSSDKIIKQSILENTETVNELITNKKVINYYNEYLFSCNVPLIDFKEIFSANFNLLNRLNIITLDNLGKLYYSYLGSSYEDTDKSIIHLGTSNKNINIGTDTLINEEEQDAFKKINTISIDFDNIILNSNNLKAKQLINQQKTNDVTFYSTVIKPVGEITDNKIYIKYEETINNGSTSYKTFVNGSSIDIYTPNIIYIPVYNYTTKNLLYYVLSINNLFKTILGLDEILFANTIYNDEDKNINIRYNGVNHNIIKIKKDEIYYNFIPIYDNNINKFSQNINIGSKKYASLNNTLSILYYEYNNELYIEIETLKDYDDPLYNYKSNYDVLIDSEANNKFN